MNYRIYKNKMTSTWQIINLSTKVVVRELTSRDKALTYLRIVNNPRHGL